VQKLSGPDTVTAALGMGLTVIRMLELVTAGQGREETTRLKYRVPFKDTEVKPF
jgi:hypothetical protein